MDSSSRRAFLKFTGSAAAGALWPSVWRTPHARPNILFFFPDQHRFDWMGANAQVPVRMPVLDGLATRGVRFRSAYCASPLCGPSRACLASGREYDRCGVPRHGISYPVEQTTFYSLLRASGYHVMGCGKFDLDKGAQSWGDDGKNHLRAWGFSDGINNAGKWDAMYSGAPKDPFIAFLKTNGLREAHIVDMNSRRDEPRLDPRSWGHYRATHPTPLPERAYCDNWIARKGLELLRRAPAGQPWFLQVNFAGPHEPMDVTEQMHAAVRARGRDFPQPNRNTQLPPEEHEEIRCNYAAMIENIDRWLGIYLEALERRGELAETLIIFSSDHGEMLGDQNRWAKSTPYEPSVGVPLVIAGLGVRRGHESRALVSVIDIAATSLDAAGVEIPSDMDARSLKPLLQGRTDRHRDYLLSGLYGWRTLREGRYKLVRGFQPETGPEGNNGEPTFAEAPVLLFDLGADPWETENLAHLMPGRVEQMTELLVAVTQ